MKKIILLVVCMCFFTGCGKNNSKNVIKNITKKIDTVESYHLDGILEIINDENSYKYDVDVTYLKDNNFKVSLTNQINNHEQVILRNKDGVYVLTPSLNKSFKFQSEWPYNNSQSYLLHNLVKDIKEDNEYQFEQSENEYIITTKVNYSNNKELVKQKIYVNKEMNINKVEVLDNNNMLKIRMSINNIDYNKEYDTEIFKLENNITVSTELNETSVSKLDEIIYPMYIPENTYLSSQDKVSKESGERVIMTFAGEHPFMLVQETINPKEITITSVKGEPFQLHDAIGIIDETSLTWIDQGVEYYLVSNTLNQEQLINVANSLTTAAIEK